MEELWNFLPSLDQVADGIDGVISAIPPQGWTIIAGIILAAIAKAIFRSLNFKMVSFALIVILFAMQYGVIGKG